MELYQYNYSFRNLTLTIDKNYNLMDGAVVSCIIAHDYMARRLPIIRVSLELQNDIIGLIYDKRDDVLFKMDIYEQQCSAEGEVLSTKLYLRHSFNVIPVRDRNSYVTSRDSGTMDMLDPMQELQLFEMYLVDKEAVKWFTTQTSTIFQDISRPEVLQALFVIRGIPAGTVIATPPESITKINNIILPLGDLIGNIDTVNKAYGIYDSYPVIYYDMQYLYCINRFKPNIVYDQAGDYGTITFTLRNPLGPDYHVTGSFNDLQNRTHFVNLNHEPVILDETAQHGSTDFATLATVDSSGRVEKTTVDEDATAIAYTFAHNDLTSRQVLNETTATPIITVSAENCAVSFLRPYKRCSFDVDTQFMDLDLMGHSYYIRGWTLTIQRETRDKYLHTVEITMARLLDR